MTGRWFPLGLVAVATVVGAWARIALAASSGLWRDEVQSLAVSRLPTLSEMFSFLVQEESHPPLFYLLERAWTSVVGTSDVAIVGLGLIPGILLVPAVALVAWRSSGPPAAVLVAWLVALAWPAVRHAGDGRPYALLSLLAVGATAAALTAVRRPGPRPWTALSACSITLVYTHNWALLVVTSLALLTLLAAWRDAATRRPQFQRWGASFGVVAVAWLPWVPAVIRQARHAGYPPPAAFPVEWLVVLPILLLAVTVHLIVPTALALGIGAWGRRPSGSRPDPARFFALAALLPALLAAAAWPVTDLTLAHCAEMLAPLMLVAIAFLLTRQGVGLRRGLVAGVAFSAILAAATLTWRLEKSNLRDVAELVSAEVAEGDLVIIFPSTLAPSFRRYATVEVEVLTFPPRGDSGPTRFSKYVESYEDPAMLAPILDRISAPGMATRRVWLVSQLWNGAFGDLAAAVGTRERWRLNYDERLREIGDSLRATNGLPELIFPPADDIYARERVRVERYGS